MRPPVEPDTDETRFGALLDWRLMTRFLGYTRPYTGWIWLALLLLPLATGLQLLQPMVLKLAVDRHLTSGNLEGFDVLLWAFGLLIGGQFLVGYLQSLVNTLLGQRVVRDIRQALFQHLVGMDAAFFSRAASGRITNRLTSDTEAVSQMVSAGLINLVGDLLLLGGIAVSMFLLSPRLSLVTILSLPLMVLVTQRVARSLRRVQRQGRIVQARMAGQITEESEGHQVVRLFHRQRRNHATFAQRNAEYYHSALRANLMEAFQFSFVELASSVVVGLMLWYGAGLSETAGGVTIGTLVAFIDYIRRLFLPIRDLSGKFTTMQAAMTAMERIFDLLDTPPGITNAPGASSPTTPLRGAVRYDGVHFDYGKGEVLKGIDLTIRAGERVAVAGPTGAGKSSLIKLLNRTWQPTAGTVFIDGVDVTLMPLATLRRTVGVVQQETFLFAGTIAANIGLNDPAISRERIRWAVEQTGAAGFIDQLPEGLDTPLAERGVNLSVGQRQLLGIARVLAFDPLILVMDEATSSVDTISERLIQQAMAVLLRNRTALIIAHRLSTILDADRIVVLSHGRIVEQGNHTQLLAAGGLYARLYQLQFQAENPTAPPLEPQKSGCRAPTGQPLTGP